MIQIKAIKEVLDGSNQCLSPVFLVPKKDGDQRAVINLMKLNQYVEYQPFKMEGIQALKALLRKGDFMVNLNLSDAYFGVPIKSPHRKYLRFSWRGKFYEFQASVLG